MKTKKDKQRQSMSLFDETELITHDSDNITINNNTIVNKRDSSINNADKICKSSSSGNRRSSQDTDKSKSKLPERNRKVVKTTNAKSRCANTDTKSSTNVSAANNKSEIKVGRKDRKHNWWPNCDHVWVDGIDHWVSKTAFRNDGNSKPVYSINNYVQGLDSYWCLRYKPANVVLKTDSILQSANEELNKHYKSWEELSTNSKLTEAFIKKYKDHIRWTIFIDACNKSGRTFTKKFKDKFSVKFSMVDMIK